MKTNRILGVFIILIFCLACDKELQPKYLELKDKLSIRAEFNKLSGITVSVEKAVPLTVKSFLYDTLIIKDARVLLVDSVSAVTWHLVFDEKLSLYQNPILKPVENHAYFIEINWKSHQLKSKVIVTPKLPKISVLKSQVTETQQNYGGYEFTYSLSLDSIKSNQYFQPGAFFKEKYFDGRPFAFEEYIQREDQCGYKNGIILPSFCLGEKVENVTLHGYIFRDRGNDMSKLYKGKHYIYFASISLGFYNLYVATAEPEPFERFFLNPAITPSDFPNALGTFNIRNMEIIDSILIK